MRVFRLTLADVSVRPNRSEPSRYITGVVTTRSPAYQRPDGVHVILIAALGP